MLYTVKNKSRVSSYDEHMTTSSTIGTNWSGTYAYRASAVHTPTSLDELRSTIASATRIRVLGSRHSFSDIADSDRLVSLQAMPANIAVDANARTVSCGAAVTYGQLAKALQLRNLAIHNMASLPHISVGGSVATATHGSGDRNGNLATAVAGLQIVTSTGDVVNTQRGDPDFEGMVVAFGALGAVSRITLDTEPAFDMRQIVYCGMPWEQLIEQFDGVMASGYSVSVFTRWTGTVDQIWVKTRAEDAVHDDVNAFGQIQTVDLNPVPGTNPQRCTTQQGIIGPWCDRLPHFRMEFSPSSGDEIQSEYMIPRQHATAALVALRAIADHITPHLLICELRTVAADALWMSPQYCNDTLAVHFTWKPDAVAVDRALVAIESALQPFGWLPHWGKIFRSSDPPIGNRFTKSVDFVRLVEMMDPRAAFRNAWLDRHLGSST